MSPFFITFEYYHTATHFNEPELITNKAKCSNAFPSPPDLGSLNTGLHRSVAVLPHRMLPTDSVSLSCSMDVASVSHAHMLPATAISHSAPLSLRQVLT